MKTWATLSLLVLSACTALGQEAAEILDRMDAAMNFDEGLMVLSFEDRKADGSGRVLRAKVSYALKSGTLVEFLAPEREKGKRVLMIGDSMWLGAPTVSKPIRLSGKDSFMGTSFTNDDVLNLDKSDDYDSALVQSEGGGWTLELRAKTRKVPYPRILLTVGFDYLPLRMELFSLSGLRVKEIEFSDPRLFGGKRRPATMTVVDAMTSGNRTIVRFEELRPGAVDPARLTPTGFMR